jgi:integrase
MASIHKRKNSDGKTRYRALIRLKGFPPQCATFTSLTAARQWVKCTEAAMLEGRHFKTGEARKRTLAELINRYLQSRECDSITTFRLKWWKKQIGYKILADVEPCVIAEMRDKLLASTTNRGTSFSPATVVRYMAAISHAFSIAVKEWGWIDDSPMRKVARPREPRGRVRFLSDDERGNLLEACRNSYNPYLYRY